MGYYMGDYYAGDYYRGDPGFFGFLKKAVGIGASFIPGVGGVIGKAVSKIPGGVGPKILTAGTAVGRVMAKHPVLSAAGAAGAIGVAGRMGAARPGVGMRGMPRGAARAAGMPGRRGRRMNVTNVRALRRSIRRAQGFSRLAKRVLRFTSPRPVRGRAIFKARRRRKI
jgi:hypothetical protein